MRRADALPTIWLMTDERLGDALWPAIMALPRGAGIVFRHHATDAATRLPGEHGVHNAAGAGLRSAAVHSVREGIAARRQGVDLVFISPVYATRTHPGAATLGALRAATIARYVALPAIALGGMDARRFRRLHGLGFHGWAGIDAWTAPERRQKRNAVPI
jgi:thiamine-phosphate pyrophosphorylase